MKQSASDLAKLFIPGHERGLDALRWRVQLIDREKLYPLAKMVEILKAAQSKTLSPKIERELLRQARSDEIVLDELEVTTLIVTGWLLQAETLSQERLLFIDRNARCFFRFFGTEDQDEYLKLTRSNLRRYGERLLETRVLRIRAKVAFQEVVAMISPNEMIPDLVALSPRYLGNELVQKWIRLNQYRTRSIDRKTSSSAAADLKRLTRAIEGDKRSQKKRRYAYWRIAMLYEDLVMNIKNFRRLRKEGDFDQQYFDMYCEEYKISSPYPSLMLDKARAPGQLALDILVAQGLIVDSRSFEEFRPIVNRIQKKHFGGEILSVAKDAFPIISDFLDLPTTHPEFTLAADPMIVLEKVPVAFPRPNSQN